jgi:hypothetical protein
MVYIECYDTVCCGVYEFHSLVAPRNESPQNISKLVDRLVNPDGLSGQGYFVLTKNRDGEILQPEWFVAELKKLPGFHQCPWYLNPNSGNYCSICVWTTEDNVDSVHSS